jgi:glycosyltransferase involved in cell wall biosynthesis
MGVPELVEDGKSGLVVAPGRVDALAAALGKLVNDPAGRVAMGKAGRAKVCAEYRLEEQVARLAAPYRELGSG